MSDTMWFNKKPGQIAVVSAKDEEPAVLVGTGAPDWVRLPPDLGGERRRVESAFVAPCPCGQGHQVTHLDMGPMPDGQPGRLGVAECIHRGFLWYQREG